MHSPRILAAPRAHGAIMTGDAVHQALDGVRALAGRPVNPSPGQEVLDALVAHILAGAAA
jgi:hypothetical protein